MAFRHKFIPYCLLVSLFSSFVFILPVHATNHDVTITLESADASTGAAMRVDGTTYRDGQIVSLSAGNHTFEAVTPANWPF